MIGGLIHVGYSLQQHIVGDENELSADFHFDGVGVVVGLVMH
jgi:hypothetical protein